MTIPATPSTIEPFDATDVIAAKCDGATLTNAQTDWAMEAYIRGATVEEQMSVLTITIYLRGMSRAGIARWTEAMIAPREHMNFSGLSRPTADKHFTGGVGDKITLPLAPLAVVFRVNVPQLPRRGLGRTGGTPDRLESIPGWQIKLMGEKILAMLDADGPGAIIYAVDAGPVSADKRLYALCGTAATVSRVPLIASSIILKKIAGGIGTLVLGVKIGSGAFMKELDQARELVLATVALGIDAGVTIYVLLTDTSTLLGRTAGNALEAAESLEVLTGGGSAGVTDLIVALALKVYATAGRSVEEDVARIALADGWTMDIWHDMILRQGGNSDTPLPLAPEIETVTTPTDGVLTVSDALTVEVVTWRLGAGRARKEDLVQAITGVIIHTKPGDEVRTGQPLLTLRTVTPECFTRAREALASDIIIFEAGSPEAADTVARRRCGVILECIG